ncbi:hypothetical protein [Methylosinus sp. PW1]|uniref:hypothetical protein n=1 Tax=Methylosinus sp. PW1 TaxID=107636 RepID=UPI00055B7F4B|nr:hypothetical protein [Methylosinus sp. PW1]
MDNERLKAVGVSRDPENDRTLHVAFNRPVTDDEMRVIHDALRGGLDTLVLGALEVGLEYGSRGFAAKPAPGVKH